MDPLEEDFEFDVEFRHVLEMILHPELWKKSVSMVIFLEKCITFWSKKTASMDIFFAGSYGEGLASLSPLMKKKSDVDVMGTFNTQLVVERHYPDNHPGVEILKLEHSHLYPGYALLRLLSNTFEDTYLSANEWRSTVERTDTNDFLRFFGGSNLSSTTFSQGPAVTVDISPTDFHTNIFGPFESVDMVFAIHCNEWPSVADEWIERDRANWPSGDMIAHVVEMGCDLVPAGVRGSITEDKEWRISFVRAERYLIHSLNPAQLKTFVLLKIIFKNKVFGNEFHNKVSSYVAKCSFLWVSEEYYGHEWMESHCMKYLWLCLRKIMHFVAEGHCPNYFMRECNVLYEKLNTWEQRNLSSMIEGFTRMDCFKERIKSLPVIDGVRNTLTGLFVLIFKIFKSPFYMEVVSRLIDRCWEEIFGNLIYFFVSTPSNENLVNSIEDTRNWLRSFRENTASADIFMNNYCLQDFFIRLFTCFQLRLVNIAVDRDELSKNGRFEIIQRLLSQAKLQTPTLCASEIVQLAHVFFTNGLYENTLRIITPMLCAFEKIPCFRLNSLKEIQKMLSSFILNMTDVSFTSVRRPVCDIVFFYLEESILTFDLRLELFCTKIESEENVDVHAFFSYVTVHPLVYAYYMKYKCCRNMKRNIDSCRVLRELERLVLNDTVREYSGLNLLGSCFFECGYFENALKIFVLSSRKRGQHRSVFYHTAILLRTYFKNH